MNTKIFQKAYDDLMKLQEGGRAFKRSGLTPYEYTLIYDIMRDMSYGITLNTTISEKVADWFRKHNFNVKPENIGWVISLD